jgi:hypothetical protein
MRRNNGVGVPIKAGTGIDPQHSRAVVQKELEGHARIHVKVAVEIDVHDVDVASVASAFFPLASRAGS